MVCRRRLTAFLICSVVVLGAGCALAGDWPQWRGVDRDGKVADFAAPETWPQALALKWKVSVGPADATPALVGDRLYAFTRQGGDEVAMCLNAADGSKVWDTRYAAAEVTGPGARHPGPRSSPAVADGKVVALGAAGVVSCFDAANGTLLWQKDPYPGVVPQFFASMSPLIVDGMAIAQVGGQGNGAVIAFDLATGEEKWRWAGEAPQYASPAVMAVDGAKHIVTLTEKSMVGLNAADGKLLWSIDCPPQRRAYNSTTPIISGDIVIYTGHAGQPAGVKAVKIEKQDDAFVPRELWANGEVTTQFCTPVLVEGLLFGISNKGNLFCLNAETGETAWIDEAEQGRGGFGCMVNAGSVVFALSSDPTLVVLEPSAEGYKELARYKVAEGATYAHPVVAGTSIFVKDEDALSLWIIQ